LDHFLFLTVISMVLLKASRVPKNHTQNSGLQRII
jgi:hypothetical protein